MATPVDLIGYHITFDAEMTTSADMAKFRTTFENGDRTLYNNHEGEAYADYNTANPANPFIFNNGALAITATPTPYNGQPYTSGLIQTSGTFTQNTGYFEIRAKTPNTHGFWSAFWMLPPSAGYPELDILEQPNNSGLSQYWTFIGTPTDHSGGFTDVGVDLSAGYHTYGLLWNATTVQFTLDGNLIGSPHATPPALIGQQMYLLANLAVGNSDPRSWAGQPDAGASAAYNIDYIRAYSNNPNVAAVAMQPISSPDGVDTTPHLTGNFIIANQTTGQQTVAAGAAYTGPVSGLEREFILVTPNNVNITAQVPNVFINSGSGMDALDVSKSNGNNVLDGGTGSNFLTGGTGFDTFFLDYRNPTVDLFSTIVNFHSGDNLTIFGINQTDYMLKLLDNQGAVNAKGLDFAVDAPGKPHGNVVLAGFSSADIGSGKLTLSYGRTQDLPGLPGSEYLNIHGN